jgi:heme/copper-type cytochrome/quinol oxidase subunit 2
MPIEVHVVSEQAFTAWVADAKKKYADNSRDAHPTAVAAAQ